MFTVAQLGYAIAAFGGFATLGFLVVRRLPLKIRSWCLLLLSLVFIQVAYFRESKVALIVLLGLGLVVFLSGRSRFLVPKNWQMSVRAFAYAVPVATLFSFKYFTSLPAVMGLSYMSFRWLSWLHETADGPNFKSQRVSFDRFLAYSFYGLTLQMGPISRYSPFVDSLQDPAPVDVVQRLTRVTVGLLKLLLLSQLVNQVGLPDLLATDHMIPVGRLALACVASYLYVYFSFSGFCDIVIGISELIGVRVDENFDFPLLSRNIHEFWTRWHMSLSTLVQKLVFFPLSVILARRLPKQFRHIVAPISAAAAMITIGMWHGLEPRYLYLGLFHAFGWAVVWAWGRSLDLFGKNLRKTYNDNLVIRIVSIGTTIFFVSASMLLFVLTQTEMESLRARLSF